MTEPMRIQRALARAGIASRRMDGRDGRLAVASTPDARVRGHDGAYNRRMSTPQTADREIDPRGLNCPLPILRTKKALNDMQSGQVVRIVATDPASVRDFEAFARQTGNALIEHGESDGTFWFLMRRR